MSVDRQPQYEEENDLVRELQELAAAQHHSINTMEQGRLDAIARLAMADSYTTPQQARRIEKVQQKQIDSIKARQPEFVADDEEIRTLQQMEAAKHSKIDTMEQSRLDMIARLAMSDRKEANSAKELQKHSILLKHGDLLDSYNSLKNRTATNNNGNGSGDSEDSNGHGTLGTKSRQERPLHTNGNGQSPEELLGRNPANSEEFDYANTAAAVKKLRLDMNNMHSRYLAALKNMEERYLTKIENLQSKIESDKALLRSKDERIAGFAKENAKSVNTLKKSKYTLIKATSKEIDSLRKQIKMYNKGRIDN